MKTTMKNKKSSSTYEAIYRVELFWCNDWTNMFTTHELFDAKVYAKGLIDEFGKDSVRLMRELHVLTNLSID